MTIKMLIFVSKNMPHGKSDLPCIWVAHGKGHYRVAAHGKGGMRTATLRPHGNAGKSRKFWRGGARSEKILEAAPSLCGSKLSAHVTHHAAAHLLPTSRFPSQSRPRHHAAAPILSLPRAPPRPISPLALPTRSLTASRPVLKPTADSTHGVRARDGGDDDGGSCNHHPRR